MSDRAQTLLVEMEPREIEWSLAALNVAERLGEKLLGSPTSEAERFKNKLRNALSQPEHQGEETITVARARMQLREAFETSESPQDGTDLEYFIRRALPAEEEGGSRPSGDSGEVGRLQERLESEIEERRGWAAAYRDLATRASSYDEGQGHVMRAERLDEHTDRLQALLDAPPSDSQGDQERCKRCGGSKIARLREGEHEPAYPCPDCNPAPTQVEQWENDEAEAMVTRLIAGLRQVAGPRTDKAVNVEVAVQNVHFAADLLEAQQRERRRQPEPGGEEDWAELAIARDSDGAYEVIAARGDEGEAQRVADFELGGHETRRYLPATSQDSSGLGLDSVVERLEARAERSETALEEIAETFTQEAETYSRKRAKCKADEATDRASGKLKDGHSYEATWNYYEGIAKGYEQSAQLVREKAAQLKEGER